MADLAIYKKILGCKSLDQAFDHIILTLKPSNRFWTYFVNWEKVLKNAKEVEVALNTFNYLLGKDDFDKEFKFLLRKNPEVAAVIPALIVRDSSKSKKFKILVDYKKKKLVYKDYDFGKDKITDSDIKKFLVFVKATGLKGLLTSKRIKNLVDYMVGVEAGLDSNGRKNRGGQAMEDIVEVFIRDVCKRKGFTYFKEANAAKIKDELGYVVPVDKSSRRYDFVVDNRKELFIIETNFYSGGGSKLKSTAGEYRSLYDVLKGKYKFVWITDGFGWKKAANPLRETFDYNKYLFNLSMLEQGAFEYLLSGK